MNWRRWTGDTIARRFALTISLAFAATFAMNTLFVLLAGAWGRPPLLETGLLNSAATAIRIIETLPPAERDNGAAAASGREYRVRWHSGDAPLAITERIRNNFPDASVALRGLLGDPRRDIVFFASDSREIGSERFLAAHEKGMPAYFMGVELRDRSWLMFIVPERQWGIGPVARGLLEVFFAAISIVLLATVTARTLARPVEHLAQAVRRFGTDPRAPPLAVSGPAEMRTTIAAFNAMQAQIGRFVQDRTSMLAAISHDLRTPLTRMRLRAELIEDAEQQNKLFRDVDEMQHMVDSALTFFRDDGRQEPTTSFDLPELLKSIVDDYGDQGILLEYAGPDHVVHRGRPMALRRVFVNLVDNAVKYATPPVILLRMTAQGAEVTVRDNGPGIPEEEMERVFAPFYRLDRSRNRATGGVGLGLTAARSMVRAHGGDLVLGNRAGASGLDVCVTLPAAEDSH